MQLTHSPSARIPSTRALFPSPPSSYPLSADVSPYSVPPDSYERAASSHPNPFPSRPPHPPRRATPLRSLRLDETFDSFGGNLHSPRRPPIFSSLRRPIHRVSTRSTLSYRSPSEYTYSPPLTSRSHCERQQQDRPRGFLQDGGGKVAVYIVSFF